MFFRLSLNVTASRLNDGEVEEGEESGNPKEITIFK